MKVGSIPTTLPMDGPTISNEGGKVTYRASALGQCTKALIALRLGYEPLRVPDKIQTVFDRGHEYEDIALAQLVKDGWKLYDKQAAVYVPITGKLVVKGHIDSKGYYNDRGYVVEVKSQSQLEWDRFEKEGWESGFFPKYKWQASSYMIASHMELALVRINRETDELAVLFIEKPWYSTDQIRQRILEVEAWAARGELPATCEKKDYPCPVFYLHDDEDIKLADSQVEQLAVDYKAAIVEEKAAKGKKDAARKALELAAGDDRKLKTDNGWKITFFEKANRPSYDFTKLSEEALAEVEKAKVVTKSLSIRITEPKEANDEGRINHLD